jgi:hypothetical protein
MYLARLLVAHSMALLPSRSESRLHGKSGSLTTTQSNVDLCKNRKGTGGKVKRCWLPQWFEFTNAACR